MNITIRTAKPSDAGQLLEIFTPYVRDTAISFEYTVPTVGEFSERIGNTLKKYPYFVADADGELVGYTYETTIYVKTGMRRAGIGARLYERLEEALKAQGILNLNACIAYTETDDAHLTNDSVAFHEKCGYQMVGRFHKCGYKFQHWYDMVWMEKLIGERR